MQPTNASLVKQKCPVVWKAPQHTLKPSVRKITLNQGVAAKRVMLVECVYAAESQNTCPRPPFKGLIQRESSEMHTAVCAPDDPRSFLLRFFMI